MEAHKIKNRRYANDTMSDQGSHVCDVQRGVERESIDWISLTPYAPVINCAS